MAYRQRTRARAVDPPRKPSAPGVLKATPSGRTLARSRHECGHRMAARDVSQLALRHSEKRSRLLSSVAG